MPIEIMIPRLGWSTEEANFVNWLKQDGEAVKPGEPLFALESEKATQEIEAFDQGILRIPADGPKPGDVVKVGQVIGHLLTKNETIDKVSIPPAVMPPTAPTEPKAVPGFANAANSDASTDSGSQTNTRSAISPRARRLAQELGVDTTKVRGTGPGGRITEKDVRAVTEQG